MRTERKKAKIRNLIDMAASTALLLGLGLTCILQATASQAISLIPVIVVLALCLAANLVIRVWRNRGMRSTIQFYEGILDAIPFMIHSTDMDMNWHFFNKATSDFLGLDREESAGKHCSNWNAEICGTDRCSAHCLRNGNPTTFFEQSGMNLRVDTNWLLDENKQRAGYVEVVQDISEMVSLQRQTELISEIRKICSSFVVASSEIATGAQMLAKGSTEQAASVEELNTAITEVTQRIDENLAQAEKAAQLSQTVQRDAEDGNNYMRRMTEAVGEISDASHSIKKVIKAIDAIAFQTNILALNAAVEAARAGQHGKGFAVVADEVRSLASKSAEAARDTSALIEDSIVKAELGASITNDTATALQKIIEGIEQSSALIEGVAHSSQEHYAAFQRIQESIGSVSQVVQQNSATAEQSAAASEEMNNQTRELQQMLHVFQSMTPGVQEQPQRQTAASGQQSGMAYSIDKY